MEGANFSRSCDSDWVVLFRIFYTGPVSAACHTVGRKLRQFGMLARFHTVHNAPSLPYSTHVSPRFARVWRAHGQYCWAPDRPVLHLFSHPALYSTVPSRHVSCTWQARKAIASSSLDLHLLFTFVPPSFLILPHSLHFRTQHRCFPPELWEFVPSKTREKKPMKSQEITL